MSCNCKKKLDTRETQDSETVFSINQLLLIDVRSTVLLVSSTKCVLRHPDSASARENRDTVFCQMRRAIDLIHWVIREGISPDLETDLDLMQDMQGVPYQVTIDNTESIFIYKALRPFVC